MKILHLCLGSFYIDNYSYQENMLPKYHKEMGHHVEIITNLASFDKNGKPCFLEQGSVYTNEYGIQVTRLDFKWPLKISRILKISIGTYAAIKEAKPDFIFIHGCQFWDMRFIVQYIKENPSVQIVVDNHADFSNSATNWISKNILHRIIWRRCAQMIEPYTTKFYGVLPARVDFLIDMYGIPPEKVELLVMGADDEKVSEAKNESVRTEVRKKYGIAEDDFLIMTGGKIDPAKRQTLLLMDAVRLIDIEKVKLIVFGSVVNEMKDELNSKVDGIKVQYIGWIDSQDSYKMFSSCELAVFPGRHSVLWEQVVGQGIPCVFKYWKGTSHADIGGNCKFLYEDSLEEIKRTINEIYHDKELYQRMKSVAYEKGMEVFSYHKIAQRSIDIFTGVKDNV